MITTITADRETRKLCARKAMSPLDRSIYIHFLMVGGDLGIIFALCCAMMLLAVNLVMIFILLPLTLAVTYFSYKVYRKLFYDSLYGESASLFLALPVSMRDMVRAKIFVAGAGSLIVQVAFSLVAICSAFMLVSSMSPMKFMEIALQNLRAEGAAEGQLSWIAALAVLKMLLSVFCQSAVIMTAVCAYQYLLGRIAMRGLRGDGSRLLLKLILVVLAVTVNVIINDGMKWVFDITGLGYTVFCAGMELLLVLVVLLISVRGITAMLQQSDEVM